MKKKVNKEEKKAHVHCMCLSVINLPITSSIQWQIYRRPPGPSPHDSQHLCTRLKDWWDKSNVTQFLRGQAKKKNRQWKKSRWSLFILDYRKWWHFNFENDNVKVWVEVIIITFLYAVATVDVLMANSHDVNLAKTRYAHFAWTWNRRLVLIE